MLRSRKVYYVNKVGMETFSALAILSILSTEIFCSPRSIAPIYVR